MMLAPGQMLSHYRLVEKIGEGGMGVVWKAFDTKLDREIAIKVLPEEIAADTDCLARFEREAKAIAALNHPNIVTIHSIEESEAAGEKPEKIQFLTMELVSGRPLSELIPKHGMALGQILDLGLALTEAMTAAHEKNITHRDLKPDNIMVDDGDRLKILDFGLAKLKQEIAPASPGSELPTRAVQTEDGRILGTVAYMSPEQAEGKPVDPRSDVFSMGVLVQRIFRTPQGWVSPSIPWHYLLTSRIVLPDLLGGPPCPDHSVVPRRFAKAGLAASARRLYMPYLWPAWP